MRIRDWSSDVCSSDLAVLHDPATFSSADGMGALMSGRVGRLRIDARGLFGLDMRELRVLIATAPPNHNRLRRLLSRADRTRVVWGKRGSVRVYLGGRRILLKNNTNTSQDTYIV